MKIGVAFPGWVDVQMQMIGHARAAHWPRFRADVESLRFHGFGKILAGHLAKFTKDFVSPNEEASTVFRYGTAIRWPTLYRVAVHHEKRVLRRVTTDGRHRSLRAPASDRKSGFGVSAPKYSTRHGHQSASISALELLRSFKLDGDYKIVRQQSKVFSRAGRLDEGERTREKITHSGSGPPGRRTLFSDRRAGAEQLASSSSGTTSALELSLIPEHDGLLRSRFGLPNI